MSGKLNINLIIISFLIFVIIVLVLFMFFWQNEPLGLSVQRELNKNFSPIDCNTDSTCFKNALLNCTSGVKFYVYECHPKGNDIPNLPACVTTVYKKHYQIDLGYLYHQ